MRSLVEPPPFLVFRSATTVNRNVRSAVSAAADLSGGQQVAQIEQRIDLCAEDGGPTALPQLGWIASPMSIADPPWRVILALNLLPLAAQSFNQGSLQAFFFSPFHVGQRNQMRDRTFSVFDQSQGRGAEYLS